MTPAEVIDTWLDRVWVQEDASAIDGMLVAETIARGIDAQPKIGPDQFKQFHGRLLCLIGNIEIDIDRQLADGEWISSLITLKATKRGTDDKVEVTGQMCAKIVEGKIVDAHNHIDFLALQPS